MHALVPPPRDLHLRAAFRGRVSPGAVALSRDGDSSGLGTNQGLGILLLWPSDLVQPSHDLRGYLQSRSSLWPWSNRAPRRVVPLPVTFGPPPSSEAPCRPIRAPPSQPVGNPDDSAQKLAAPAPQLPKGGVLEKSTNQAKVIFFPMKLW